MMFNDLTPPPGKADVLEKALQRLNQMPLATRRDFFRKAFRCAAGIGLATVMKDLLLPQMALGANLAAPADSDELMKPATAAKTGQFIFPRLRFSSNYVQKPWNISPLGDANLRYQLAKCTNINVSQEPVVVSLDNFDDMVLHPFVFMTSEASFVLTDVEEKNFKEFLDRGGFILADDCCIGNKGDDFFRCYCALVSKLYPDNPMRKVPYDHEIFHIYYDFKEGAPHCQGVPHGMYGLFEPGTARIMTTCTPGDIHCGWCNRWFTPEKNQASIQMGINIIIYFLSH